MMTTNDPKPLKGNNNDILSCYCTSTKSKGKKILYSSPFSMAAFSKEALLSAFLRYCIFFRDGTIHVAFMWTGILKEVLSNQCLNLDSMGFGLKNCPYSFWLPLCEAFLLFPVWRSGCGGVVSILFTSPSSAD